MKHLALLICLFLFNVSFSQPPSPLDIKPKNMKLFAEFHDSYGQAESATTMLLDVIKIVKKIEAKESDISVPTSDWNELANNYKVAAEKIQKASLISDFDKTAFRLTVDEIANCQNKATNMAKLNAYKNALNLALVDGKLEINKIELYKKHIESSRQALKYLKDVHAKLITNPLFFETFKWDWLALNTSVSTSLASLNSAVSLQENKLVNEINKIKLHHDNLGANIDFLTANTCTFAGSYATGQQYSASSIYKHGNCRWRMDFSGVKVSFNISADQQVHKATLTVRADETPLQGSCPDHPASNDRYEYFNSRIEGNNITINFTPVSSNRQKCRAQLNGTIINGQISSFISFRRYDQPNFPSVQYTIDAGVLLKKDLPGVPSL